GLPPESEMPQPLTRLGSCFWAGLIVGSSLTRLITLNCESALAWVPTPQASARQSPMNAQPRAITRCRVIRYGSSPQNDRHEVAEAMLAPQEQRAVSCGSGYILLFDSRLGMPWSRPRHDSRPNAHACSDSPQRCTIRAAGMRRRSKGGSELDPQDRL